MSANIYGYILNSALRVSASEGVGHDQILRSNIVIPTVIENHSLDSSAWIRYVQLCKQNQPALHAVNCMQ